jgi:hypothetical protein
MRKRLIILLFFSFGVLFAQPGGENTYQFLNLPTSATLAALGGKNISINDKDLAMASQNPALLNYTMHQNLVLNYSDFFADINYGYFSYAQTYKNLGNFAGAIQFINYGHFTETDETGEVLGAFGASEYALNVFWSKSIDSNFTFGINVKPIMSFMERYQSYGIATDFGATYYNKPMQLTAAMVLRNFGTQIITYNKSTREPLPFEVLMGLTHKLHHAPFRVSVTRQQLQMPDMSYESVVNKKTTETLIVDTLKSENKTMNNFFDYSDKVIRHLIFGVELIPVENFYLRVGYNYQRRQELKIPDRVSMVGFSWGFGVRISKFHLSYGRASYHVAGATNYFSITTNISSFKKKYDNNIAFTTP